jgi:hypothetical protein
MAALGAGDEAVAAPGSLHAWGNPGEQRSVAHVELRPGSRGFEKGLRVAYGLAADGRVLKNGVSRNPLQASLLLEMGEVRLPGAYAALQRILGLPAHLARWRGVDRELKRRCSDKACPPQRRKPASAVLGHARSHRRCAAGCCRSREAASARAALLPRASRPPSRFVAQADRPSRGRRPRTAAQPE